MRHILVGLVATASMLAIASMLLDLSDIQWLVQMRQDVSLGMTGADVLSRLGPPSLEAQSPWAAPHPQYRVFEWGLRRGIVFRRYYIGFDSFGNVRYIWIENS